MTFEHIELFEQWRPVVGYEGRYEVSDWGRVRRVAAAKGAQVGKLLNLRKGTTNPYFAVWLYRSTNGKDKGFQVHRLVAAAFIGPCPPGKEVHHIDGDKTNNCLPNLSYVTRGQNIAAEYRSGRRERVFNERNPRCKLSRENLIEIKRLYLEGMAQAAIAKQFHVGSTYISKIIRNKVRTIQ